jgi:hypothetical protein
MSQSCYLSIQYGHFVINLLSVRRPHQRDLSELCDMVREGDYQNERVATAFLGL